MKVWNLRSSRNQLPSFLAGESPLEDMTFPLKLQSTVINWAWWPDQFRLDRVIAFRCHWIPRQAESYRSELGCKWQATAGFWWNFLKALDAIFKVHFLTLSLTTKCWNIFFVNKNWKEGGQRAGNGGNSWNLPYTFESGKIHVLGDKLLRFWKSVWSLTSILLLDLENASRRTVLRFYHVQNRARNFKCFSALDT